MTRHWRTQPSRYLRHPLVQSILSLYGVQVAGYVVPLITIPYLARVLGASGWGLVAFAQAFGAYISLACEYGFVFSATREVARHRGEQGKLASILAGVQGAKVVLAGGAVALAVAVRNWIPIFRGHPLIFWGAVFWALGQAFSMMWFFLGLEQVRLAAALDISAKSLATVGIFIFVHRPSDDWRVLAIQGAGFFLSSAFCLALAYRIVPSRLPAWEDVHDALKAGWALFLFEGSARLNSATNTFILGLFVPADLVGYYAGAEKIARASLKLLDPVNQTLYSRLSNLAVQSKTRAARLARVGVVIMGLGGAVMGGMIYLLAPQVVHVLLGPGYGPAIPVLRIMALLPPLVALSKALGGQWLIPLGLEGPFNLIIIAAGLARLAMALAVARTYADVGMAWVAVISSALVTCGVYFLLRLRGLDPIRGPLARPS